MSEKKPVFDLAAVYDLPDKPSEMLRVAVQDARALDRPKYDLPSLRR